MYFHEDLKVRSKTSQRKHGGTGRQLGSCPWPRAMFLSSSSLHPWLLLASLAPPPCIPGSSSLQPWLLLLAAPALSLPAGHSFSCTFCLHLCSQPLPLSRPSGLGECTPGAHQPREERRGEGKRPVQAFGSKWEGCISCRELGQS